MVVPIFLVILLGALLNGGTAAMENEDVAQHALYGAAGGASAVVVLAGVFWVLGLFVEFDLSTFTLG
jgi:hypothetical protein